MIFTILTGLMISTHLTSKYCSNRLTNHQHQTNILFVWSGPAHLDFLSLPIASSSISVYHNWEGLQNSTHQLIFHNNCNELSRNIKPMMYHNIIEGKHSLCKSLRSSIHLPKRSHQTGRKILLILKTTQKWLSLIK